MPATGPYMGVNSNTYKNRGQNRFWAFGENRGNNRSKNRRTNRFGGISNHPNIFLVLFVPTLFFEEIEIQRGQRLKAAGPFGGRPEAAPLFLQIIRVKLGVKIGLGG